MGGEIGVFRQHISKKGSLNCFGEKNAWLSWLNSPTHSLKCGWFLISPRILEAMRGEILSPMLLLIVRDTT